MKSTIYQRISEICETKNMSQRKFCQHCNISTTTFNTASNRNSELGMNTIVKILTTFSDISPDWLLLENGKMYREKLELSAEQTIIKELLDRNEKLSAENAVLKFQLSQK